MLKSRMCFWKGKSSVAAVDIASETQTHAGSVYLVPIFMIPTPDFGLL